MRFLFFFVHPAKYHFFKHTINSLILHGHYVDVVYTKKDILPELVASETWNSHNIFPEGRKIKGLPVLVGAAINLLRTLWRLLLFMRGKSYDLFVTDDCLVMLSFIKRTPAIFFTDNELSTVPESVLLLTFAKFILAPAAVDLEKFEPRKIPIIGYKELAYLHPSLFVGDESIPRKFNPTGERYFFIRVVSMGATHDRGITGLSDERVEVLVKYLTRYGKVFISAERKLNDFLNDYIIKIDPKDILHALYYSDMFIGDSGTMASESALLGVPTLFFHDFVGRLGVMTEKELKYQLMYGFKCSQFEEMFLKIQEILRMQDLKEVWQMKKLRMNQDTANVTNFLIWLFENFPNSVLEIKNNSQKQLKL